jgi:hypothetical protein
VTIVSRHFEHCDLLLFATRIFRPVAWAPGVTLRRSNPEPSMPASGQYLPKSNGRLMSAFPLIAIKSRTSQ